MSALLTTLPGDIPGLLLRGSPVRTLKQPDARSAVITVTAQIARVGFPWAINDEHTDALWLERLTLDLTDPTGRAHAAWWVTPRILGDSTLSADEWFEARRLCSRATEGQDLTPEQIDLLVRLVLRLAGRTP